MLFCQLGKLFYYKVSANVYSPKLRQPCHKKLEKMDSWDYKIIPIY